MPFQSLWRIHKSVPVRSEPFLSFVTEAQDVATLSHAECKRPKYEIGTKISLTLEFRSLILVVRGIFSYAPHDFQIFLKLQIG